MKLRIKGDTIRLRLLRSEVDTLTRSGTVSDEIVFGQHGTALRYSITSSNDTPTITAALIDNEIAISVPATSVRAWGASDVVGLEAIQPNGSETGLSILIEKDFACIGRDDPDRDDAYPHPTELT